MFLGRRMDMKKRFMAVVLLCILLCCSFAYASEPAVEVADFNSFIAELNNQTPHIKLTADITLTESVTVHYNVYIELDGKCLKPGNANVKLTIAEGATATIGLNVDNVTSMADFSSGGVWVNVENRGSIVGSTAFHGKVTNYGSIAAADCFFGEYAAMDGSTNASYITLTLDLDGYVPAAIPEGWEQGKNPYKDQLTKTGILRGQKLSQSLPKIARTGYTLGGWYKNDPATLFTESSPITENTTLTAV